MGFTRALNTLEAALTRQGRSHRPDEAPTARRITGASAR